MNIPKQIEKRFFTIIATLCLSVALPQVVLAQPFGVGIYGADVPFGDMTSISISLDEPSADITLTPSGGGEFSGHTTQTVTVTSTDVIGYQLFVRAASSTDMTQGANTIPTSVHVTPDLLTINSYGYNTSGSTSQFRGLTLTDTLIKDQNGPHGSGDDTSLTYGARIDMTKPSGTYTRTVTYTAIGKT